MAINTLEWLFKGVANRRRIAILAYLKKKKSARVGQIADEIRLSLKATSKHLAILSAAGFLDREQVSLEMHYRLSDDLPNAAKTILTIL